MVRIVVAAVDCSLRFCSTRTRGVGCCLVLAHYYQAGREHLAVLPPLAYQPASLAGASHPTGGRGNLILKQASRLDAFSGYPFRT